MCYYNKSQELHQGYKETKSGIMENAREIRKFWRTVGPVTADLVPILEIVLAAGGSAW